MYSLLTGGHREPPPYTLHECAPMGILQTAATISVAFIVDFFKMKF